MNLAKLVALVDRAYDDEFLDGFLALETWGNDNVSFPGECWRTWVEDLYRGDALARGTFSLSGKPARLEGVTCPLLVITFEHDAIVPKASATDPRRQWTTPTASRSSRRASRTPSRPPPRISGRRS